ncbi:transposase [Methylocystis silviterrae]|uniref:transposase n=1 Tax=Methylocystis silviterrae TaxID=2743612 RepID=UPI003C7686C9
MTPAVVIGLDGGYLRSRHRRPERNFEAIAGKVLNLDGSQHRFAFARNGNSTSEFANAVVSAGVRLGTPTTVLCDGDPGLWKLQRQVMPEATLVLDWFHIAMRFEHALQATRGLGAGTLSEYLQGHPIRELESAKWRLWHGRSSACLVRLARLTHWFEAAHVRDVRGAAAVRRHVNDLIEYLHANHLALVNYGRSRRDRQPISTAFVESAVNEILSKRMIKKQNAMEPMDRAALPRRASRCSQQNSRGFVQAPLSRFPTRQWKLPSAPVSVTNPTTLHALRTVIRRRDHRVVSV